MFKCKRSSTLTSVMLAKLDKVWGEWWCRKKGLVVTRPRTEQWETPQIVTKSKMARNSEKRLCRLNRFLEAKASEGQRHTLDNVLIMADHSLGDFDFSQREIQATTRLRQSCGPRWWANLCVAIAGILTPRVSPQYKLTTAQDVKKWIPSIQREIDYCLQVAPLHLWFH